MKDHEDVIPGERSYERHVGGSVDVVGDRREFVLATDRQANAEKHQRHGTHVHQETVVGERVENVLYGFYSVF